MNDEMPIYIVCDRCKREVVDAMKSCDGTTGGYYEVEKGQWRKFSNPGEKYVCDACMFQDERYIKVYGKVSPSRETDPTKGARDE